MNSRGTGLSLSGLPQFVASLLSVPGITLGAPPKRVVERWEVRTLNDPKAEQVDLTNVIKTTVNDLTGNRGTSIARSCRITTFAQEFKIYEEERIVAHVAAENDQDIHITSKDRRRPYRTSST